MRREDWLKDIFPNSAEDLLTMYDGLAPREVPIVLVASNDAMLEHLLRLRLVDEEGAKSLFDNRQPLGDTSSRIMFAYQVGLINREGMLMMRRLSQLRNLFAHKVNVTFTDDAVRAHVRACYEHFVSFLWESTQLPEDILKSTADDLIELRDEAVSDSDKACALLIYINAWLQSHFRNRFGRVSRLEYLFKRKDVPFKSWNEFMDAHGNELSDG